MQRRFALPAVLAGIVIALALAGVSLGGGRSLHASLSGSAEVPGPGDPDGSGFARITLNQGLGKVCWRIHVTNLTLPAAAAHIHSAVAGVAGPIVVPLSPPDASGKSSGCATGVSHALIKAIRQHPGNYYVNVHTTDFPAGAARGQLSK
jgi:CHRD domain